jgi:hypothetical protein
LRRDARGQADAFIRTHFHVEPNSLQPSTWNEFYAQAYFIEQIRLENLAKLLSMLAKAIFGGRK